MFKHHNEGFSLVELLVVVAFIAILVVVTGSQLQAYNLQGVNATASADIRNAAAAEKIFFANWGVYASSAYGAIPGAGSVLNASWNNTGPIWATSINGTAPSVFIPDPGFQISVSQNVGVVINTSMMGDSYTMGSKSTAGDRCFAMDSDTREVYWVNGLAGMFLSNAAIPTAIPGYKDFQTVVAAPCGGSAGGTGQMEWTAL